MRWINFERQGVSYDLSHLNSRRFTYCRPSTVLDNEKELVIFLSFSDHCFTDHYAQDDSWLYPHEPSSGRRYFCVTRYNLSLHLPDLILALLESNPYLLMTLMRHREQFFYLEDNFQGETYRVFLEISAPRGDYADLRIDVKSAYNESQWASSVSGSARYKLWRIIDARLQGVSLQRRRRR